MDASLSYQGDTRVHALLYRLAKRYIWRQSPEKTLTRPRELIAQVMNIGDFDDARALLDAVGEEHFKEAILNAQPGWFSARSWNYWHYRLGLIACNTEPPPLPKRTFA